MESFRLIQDKFIKQIDNSRLSNKIAHAILIEGSNSIILDKAIDYVIASLLCKEDIVCFNCDECNKVMNKNLSDLIVYDLNDSNLKKDDVIEIQNRFNLTALETSNKQFYVIKNIDKASIASLSSLLKFLEEPNDNVYAIFTTSNKNKVLKTIVSRCLCLRLKDNDLNELINVLENDYDKNDVNLVTKISKDERYIKNILDSKVLSIYKDNNDIFNKMFKDHYYIFIYELLIDLEKDELAYFFDIFYILITNKELFNIYVNDNDLYDKIINHNKYHDVLDIILSIRLYLNTNMTKALIIDKFSIRIGGLLYENS